MTITREELKVGETYRGNTFTRKVLYIGDKQVMYSYNQGHFYESCCHLDTFLRDNSVIKPETKTITKDQLKKSIESRNLCSVSLSENIWGNL